jgi:hypothetical protein
MIQNTNTSEKTEIDESSIKRKKRNRIIIIFTTIVIVLFIVVVVKNTFDNYKNQIDDLSKNQFADMMTGIFTIPEYDSVDKEYQEVIWQVFSDNDFFGKGYFFTKIPSRAKKVIAYGNFSNKEKEEKEDIAFIIEKDDFKSSMIYIMSISRQTLYSKDYDNELPTITTFKKGQKIFLENTKLENSPSDGVMLHFKNKKTALLYMPETKTFEEYIQYSDEDLKNMEKEEDSDSDESENSNEIIYRINDPNGYTNLRELKDTISIILQKIDTGSEIDVLDDTGQFWEIETVEGKKGYVHKSKIKSE